MMPSVSFWFDRWRRPEDIEHALVRVLGVGPLELCLREERTGWQGATDYAWRVEHASRPLHDWPLGFRIWSERPPAGYASVFELSLAVSDRLPGGLRLAGPGVNVDDHHFSTSADQTARRFGTETRPCSSYHKHTAIDLHVNPQKNIATSRDAALLACADDCSEESRSPSSSQEIACLVCVPGLPAPPFLAWSGVVATGAAWTCCPATASPALRVPGLSSAPLLADVTAAIASNPGIVER